jgi:hypothetical protein
MSSFAPEHRLLPKWQTEPHTPTSCTRHQILHAMHGLMGSSRRKVTNQLPGQVAVVASNFRFGVTPRYQTGTLGLSRIFMVQCFRFYRVDQAVIYAVRLLFERLYMTIYNGSPEHWCRRSFPSTSHRPFFLYDFSILPSSSLNP